MVDVVALFLKYTPTILSTEEYHHLRRKERACNWWRIHYPLYWVCCLKAAARPWIVYVDYVVEAFCVYLAAAADQTRLPLEEVYHDQK